MGRQTQTRERLVRTAGELFWRQGYAHTGVSSIMKQARATSGSFYHFFPTKDDLLVAVLDAVADLISTEILAAVENGSEDPSRRVANLIEAYRAQVVPGASGFGIPVGTLVGELGSDHETAMERVEQIYAMLTSRIAGWFVGGDEPRALAEFIVAALEGASMMAIAARSSSPIDASAIQIRRHLEAFVAGPGSRPDEMPPPDPASAETGDWKAW